MLSFVHYMVYYIKSIVIFIKEELKMKPLDELFTRKAN